METDTVLQLLPNLGISGVFVVALYIFFKYHERTTERKDRQIEAQNTALMKVVEKNTEAFHEMKGTLNANTKSNEELKQTNQTLTNQIFNLLIKDKQ